MSALADWLVAHVPARARLRALSVEQQRALVAITRCRTPAMGGCVYRCTACKSVDYAYHSCHHRACPRCGGERTAAWTQRQRERLLPVPYFMVTFTLPAELREVFRAEAKIVIDAMFAESARALQTIAAQPKHLGAQLGLVGVLHTWGHQLQLHPHIHYIVPGGGLRGDDEPQWREPKSPDWLLPAAPVATAFRAGLEAALRAALPSWHATVPSSCWRRKWVVDMRHVGSGEAALKYLARYVNKSAIDDERIVALADDHVRFGYVDSATGEHRECRLDADEFLRRYLQHVLPAGVHRVRYFGWEHPAAHRRRRQIECLLEVVITVREPEPLVRWHLVCKHCGQQPLCYVRPLPRERSPPIPRCA